jgi:hypothetical protein
LVQLSHQKRRCIQWFIDITHNQVKPTLHIDKMIDEKGCVMRSLFKKFIAIMTLSTIFITSANAVYVYRYQQEKTQWCWAASAQMIGHTLGRQVTQTDIVTQVKGMDINDGANDTEMKNAVTYATLRNSVLRSSAWPFASATNELSTGEPFLIKLTWYKNSEPNGAHAVVASGYNITSGTLTVVDPWYGCGTKAFDYNSMITNCKFQSGTGKWTATIYV